MCILYIIVCILNVHSNNLPILTNIIMILDCFAGEKSCAANSTCIQEKRWCDGNIDCPNAEDEHSCGNV